MWFEQIAAGGTNVEGLPPSVRAADTAIDGTPVRVVSVVPDPGGRFPRARSGEVGIDEGFALARAVRGAPAGSAILAIVDVPGQAFGVREEAVGLQRALAASAQAYVQMRRSGHPVFALVVGKAISGAFLAHGLQAGWVGALDDAAVEVHVMSQPAVARVTRMDEADLARVAREVPATARDVAAFATFGAIDELFPANVTVETVRAAIAAALHDGRGLRNPVARLDASGAVTTRALARDVRARLQAAWDA
jgi:biotin-independent malonate decarboxylase gamma subunit